MESLHYLLMKSHSLFSKRVLGEAAKNGLTPGQPKVLEFLLEAGEADQKTIAAHCEIEPATVGSILLRMEENGLILRRQNATGVRCTFPLPTKGWRPQPGWNASSMVLRTTPHGGFRPRRPSCCKAF